MYEPSIEWRNFGVPHAVRRKPLAPPTLPALLGVAALAVAILAVLACCLTASRVGFERARAARIDAEIARTDEQIAVLRRELAIRSRFAELDRWNAVLMLSAPRADQYLVRESQLSAYGRAPLR